MEILYLSVYSHHIQRVFYIYLYIVFLWRGSSISICILTSWEEGYSIWYSSYSLSSYSSVEILHISLYGPHLSACLYYLFAVPNLKYAVVISSLHFCLFALWHSLTVIANAINNATHTVLPLLAVLWPFFCCWRHIQSNQPQHTHTVDRFKST